MWTRFAISFVALLLMAAIRPLALAQATQADEVRKADISGTWIAKMASPMGEMEIVYKLQVTKGKIVGSQGLPFGDSPIVDGEVKGDTFHFTVALEMFGNVQKREVIGNVVDGTLVLTLALPAPPSGTGPGGPGTPQTKPDGPSGGFQTGPSVARRGTAAPSNRAPDVDVPAASGCAARSQATSLQWPSQDASHGME